MSNIAEDVIIVTSSLTKDMTGKVCYFLYKVDYNEADISFFRFKKLVYPGATNSSHE